MPRRKASLGIVVGKFMLAVVVWMIREVVGSCVM